MATTPSNTEYVTERCEQCGHVTDHDVSLELRTESQKHENREFSREPYRVSTCRECGTEGVQRMNNA